MFWRYVARPILFRLPAERIHHLSMGAFNSLLAARVIAVQFRRHYTVNDARLHSKLFGIDFRNPVGLAAGFDKDAKWFPRLACLGFSHVEVGTITGQPQPGNPQPRLFRLPADQALVNRMGFNNGGSDAAARRLATTSRFSPDDVLGVNIGKTKVVPVEQATDDYLFSFERLYLFADYFTINVSSPNTPGLRTLQNREPLIELLTRIGELNQTLAADHEIDPKPVLLKIAPDVTAGQLDDIVAIVRQTSLSGIIATNTTLSRDGLATPQATGGSNRCRRIVRCTIDRAKSGSSRPVVRSVGRSDSDHWGGGHHDPGRCLADDPRRSFHDPVVHRVRLWRAWDCPQRQSLPVATVGPPWAGVNNASGGTSRSTG